MASNSLDLVDSELEELLAFTEELRTEARAKCEKARRLIIESRELRAQMASNRQILHW